MICLTTLRFNRIRKCDRDDELLLLLLVALWSPTGIAVGLMSWQGHTRSRARLPMIWVFQLGLGSVLLVGIEFFGFHDSAGFMLAIAAMLGIIGLVPLMILHQFDNA